MKITVKITLGLSYHWNFRPMGQKLAAKFQIGNKILRWDLGSAPLLHTLESQYSQYSS